MIIFCAVLPSVASFISWVRQGLEMYSCLVRIENVTIIELTLRLRPLVFDEVICTGSVYLCWYSLTSDKYELVLFLSSREPTVCSTEVKPLACLSSDLVSLLHDNWSMQWDVRPAKKRRKRLFNEWDIRPVKKCRKGSSMSFSFPRCLRYAWVAAPSSVTAHRISCSFLLWCVTRFLSRA